MIRIQPILYFLLCTLFIGCQDDRNPCSLSEEVLKDIHEVDSLVNVPEIRERISSWNKNILDEPSLYDAENETYRFMRRSSFDDIDVYRIEKRGNVYYAIIKVFNRDADRLIFSKEKEISKEIWTKITDNLNNNNFWIYPSSIYKGEGLLDATTWELEGYKPIKDKCTLKNYHAISRFYFNDSIFMSMCNSFKVLKEEKSVK